MKSSVADVRVTHEETGEWVVWLDEVMVERFVNVSEALALAALLDCSPRARSEALAGR